MLAKPTYIHILSSIACAAGILSSCSTEAQEEIWEGKGSAVEFAVAEDSRATITSTFDKFAVYGDVKFPVTDTATPIVIFDKTEVSRQNGVWAYQGTQYWFPKHEHSFVAVYPLSVLETGNNPQYSNSNLTFTYSLPLSDEGMVNDQDVTDIVVATYRRVYNETSSATPVYLRFSHLLSQINFSLELTEPSSRSEERLKVHKLEMSGFGTSATINVKPASSQSNDQTDDSEIDIVTAAGNGSLELNFDEPIEVDNGGGSVKMFGGNNAIILLPQTFVENDDVQVRLTYSLNDEEDTTELSATLSGFTWESGKIYNYKIKIELANPNMVISNATITPWTLVDDHDEVDAK